MARNSTEGAVMADGRSRKGRISPRVREAVRLRVERGYRCEDAARAAGLSPAGYFKAMTRPHVQEYAQHVKDAYIQRSTELREFGKAQAIEVALELLREAKSESVKARMVEFLAGERDKSPQIAIQNNVLVGGYEYPPPGASLVEIRTNDPDA